MPWTLTEETPWHAVEPAPSRVMAAILKNYVYAMGKSFLLLHLYHCVFLGQVSYCGYCSHSYESCLYYE